MAANQCYLLFFKRYHLSARNFGIFAQSLSDVIIERIDNIPLLDLSQVQKAYHCIKCRYNEW